MTTNVSSDDIRHLAVLSHLQLSDEEAASLRTDVEHILAYVEQLGELDTTGVEPTYQIGELANVFRDDTVVSPGVGREALLALTPASTENHIKVPKVL